MLRKPQVWIGFVVSAVALYLAFHGIEWDQLGEALRDAQYGYLIPAAISLIVAMAIRAERWRWLFGEKRRDVSFGRAFSALTIGYLITNTLPLRLGEVARTVFVARGSKVTIAHAASTIVVEHVLDVFTILGMLVLLLVGGRVPLPDWAMQGAMLSAYAFGAALVVMLLLVWQRRRVEHWAELLLDRIPRLNTKTWVQYVVHVLDGFAVLRPGKPLVAAVVWSILGWLSSVPEIFLWVLVFCFQPRPVILLFLAGPAYCSFFVAL